MTEKIKVVKQKYTLNCETSGNERLILFKGKRERINDPFTMVFKEAFNKFLENDIPPVPMKVFMYFVINIDYGNIVCIPQKFISEKLKLDQANISRAIKYLVDHGYIARGDNFGSNKSYMLNPMMCWRGSAVNLNKARLAIVQ